MGAKLRAAVGVRALGAGALAILIAGIAFGQVDPVGLSLTGVWNLDGAVYATPQVVGGCVVVATMGGSIYCLDPTHVGVVTWRTHLADPRTIGTAAAFYGKPIGCLSKPVVSSGTIYAVCAGVAGFTVYEVSLTGAVMGSVGVSASVPGSGCGGSDPVTGGNLLFSAGEEIQRPALLLHDSTLVVAFGSNADVSPWHGWLLTYDVSATTPALTHAWASTPNSCGGAIWQSGGAVAWDGAFYYLATGNGTGEHSMQVVKLDTGLNVVATWTPAGEGTLNAEDADVGAGVPMLVGGSVLAIGFKDWRARLLFTSDLTVAADVATNPSPPPVDGDSGIYGGAFYFDGVNTQVYFPTKPGPIYGFAFTGGGLVPLVVGGAAYESTMGLVMDGSHLWAVTAAVDPYAVNPWKQVTGTLRALDPTTLVEVWSADIGRMASFSAPAFEDGAGRLYIGDVDGVVRMFSHDPPVVQRISGNSVTGVGWVQH